MRTTRLFRVLLLSCGTSLAATSALVGQAPCPVQGTWQLQSLVVRGRDEPLNGSAPLKVVAERHYMWLVRAAPPTQRPNPTVLDSVAIAQFGGGAYRVTPTTYTERLDFFYDPRWVGREVEYSCRVTGDLWYIEGMIPYGDQERGLDVREVWRRVK
jgi:hypothetical protein